MSHHFFPLTAGVLLLTAAPLCADDAEDAAVEAVENHFGKVERDGKDPAHPVIAVDLASQYVTDATLKDLAALKRLRRLNLFFTEVTDAGMKHLAALNDLQDLNLGATEVGRAYAQ